MNVVFRVDSSNEMGLGHLMRCLTLAGELKRQRHRVTFVCRELIGNLISLINYQYLYCQKIIIFNQMIVI